MARKSTVEGSIGSRIENALTLVCILIIQIPFSIPPFRAFVVWLGGRFTNKNGRKVFHFLPTIIGVCLFCLPSTWFSMLGHDEEILNAARWYCIALATMDFTRLPYDILRDTPADWKIQHKWLVGKYRQWITPLYAGLEQSVYRPHEIGHPASSLSYGLAVFMAVPLVGPVVGAFALFALSTGDKVAESWGKRWGGRCLRRRDNGKSWEGFAGFVVGTIFVTAIVDVASFWTQQYECTLQMVVAQLCATLAAALTEVLWRDRFSAFFFIRVRNGWLYENPAILASYIIVYTQVMAI